MVNVIIRSPEENELFMASPALVDIGAGYSVITPVIFETLMPFRVDKVYVESYEGKLEFLRGPQSQVVF